MPQNKENLPVNTEPVVQEGGTISYANEVIAIIAGIAASEVEGIAGMVTAGGLGEIISKHRNITRGVKVEVGTEEVSVDLYTVVEYGQPIQKVAGEVQENVRKSIESMTGLKVVRVDVHVQGVSFEKDKQENRNHLEAANIQHISDADANQKDKKEVLEKAEKGKEKLAEKVVKSKTEDELKEGEADNEAKTGDSGAGNSVDDVIPHSEATEAKSSEETPPKAPRKTQPKKKEKEIAPND